FPALPPSVLDAERFDYGALGHHHIQQEVLTRPPMYYAGSMQRVDFGEEHDEKGFMVIQLDPGRPAGERVTDVEFRRVQARRFVATGKPPEYRDQLLAHARAIVEGDPESG